MAEISTKPYFVRALHAWCTDNGYTPHLLVKVTANTRVPKAYVKNGEIVLNLNYAATRNLQLENDAITFSARFNGVSQDLYVPMQAVAGLFARETGDGMLFEPDEQSLGDAQAEGFSIVEGDGQDLSAPATSKREDGAEEAIENSGSKKPHLTIVK